MLRIECRCLKYGMQQNVTKCNEVKSHYSPNVTEYRSRNNGMLRNDLQTDLGTYIS